MTTGSGAFKLYGLFAETHVHTGSGEADMSVDLPVIREATTDYPYIPGSSLKGALRYAVGRHWSRDDAVVKGSRQGFCDKVLDVLFGRGGSGDEGGAGTLIVSDARLLLLPIRTLDGNFRYCTSPLILSRLVRDMRHSEMAEADELAGCLPALLPALGRAVLKPDSPSEVFLEDIPFSAEKADSTAWKTLADCLDKFLPKDAFYGDGLELRLTLLHDDDFKWFARYGLPVRARNALNEETKIVRNGALWYEEYIPPEAVFTVLIGDRDGASDARLGARFGEIDLPETVKSRLKDGAFTAFASPALGKTGRDYLQVGGNETVGLGWLSIVSYGREG